MPEALFGHSAVLNGSQMYVSGGLRAWPNPGYSLEATTAAAMAKGRGSSASWPAPMLVYDLTGAGSWSTLTAPPVAVALHTSWVQGGCGGGFMAGGGGAVALHTSVGPRWVRGM